MLFYDMTWYGMLCYNMLWHATICFEIRKYIMHNLPMSCLGRYVMYEMMYKNYVHIIIGFNMLWKNEGYLG